MEDKFYHKYLKYKTKYLQLKKLTGASIVDFKTIFNNEFGSDWILTGSEAIKTYLTFLNRQDLLTFTPKDVDIIYINKDMIYKETIGGFKRSQSQPEKSMTFTKDSKSFDVSTQESAYYYEIDGIKLIDPEIMLENYEENLDFRNNSDDPDKIIALREIKKLLMESRIEKKRLPIKEEKSSRFSSPIVNKRKGLFDDDNVSRNLF